MNVTMGDMLTSEQDIAQFVQQDEFMMRALRAAKSTGLSNWFIGAGFLRDTVWNIQHGYALTYTYKDLDLGYFNSDNQSEDYDDAISAKLRERVDVNWEVVNQAYAHKYSNVAPYISAEDGLAHWIETATCVAATLDENDNVKIIAPWGTSDLLELKLRLAPCHESNIYCKELFYTRIKNKKWLERWPKLRIVQ